MHKANSSATSRGGGGGGNGGGAAGLLSKTGSLFGTRGRSQASQSSNSSTKNTSTGTSTSSTTTTTPPTTTTTTTTTPRPSTASGHGGESSSFFKHHKRDHSHQQSSFSAVSSSASQAFSNLLASSTAPLTGLSRTTSSRSVKDLGRRPSTSANHNGGGGGGSGTRGHKAKAPSTGTAAGFTLLTKTKSADEVVVKPTNNNNTTSSKDTTTSSSAASSLRHRPSLSTSSTRRKLSISRQKSADSFAQLLGKATSGSGKTQAQTQTQPFESNTSTTISTTSNSNTTTQVRTATAMFAPPPPGQYGAPQFGYQPSKTPEPGSKPPGTSHSNTGFNPMGQMGPMGGGVGPGVPPVTGPTSGGPSAATGIASPHVVYQHIHEMASKRILTLDYLRKAHEGRVYWFNTLLFTKHDLLKIPSLSPPKLSRRATNYLLLGLSIPAILDHSHQQTNPLDYLRSLNALLIEFESFQQVHPPDGTSGVGVASFSRVRVPAMFKRATGTGSKTRRTSSAADIGLPMNTSSSSDHLSDLGGGSVLPHQNSGASSSSSFPTSDADLLPGEEYSHLLTPSLPFDPDFYETFATLCDVLIDCYTRILSLISSPAACTGAVGEVFSAADKRVRKVIVGGVVREFEEWSRRGVRGEIGGVGRVVLGGLV